MTKDDIVISLLRRVKELEEKANSLEKTKGSKDFNSKIKSLLSLLEINKRILENLGHGLKRKGNTNIVQ